VMVDVLAVLLGDFGCLQEEEARIAAREAA
jgi:hypothetical protein